MPTQKGELRLKAMAALHAVGWADGLPDELERACRKVLRPRASVPKTAKVLGVKHNSVKVMRLHPKGEGLRVSRVTDAILRARIPADNSVPGRIERAIGTRLPLDVRAEAIGNLYLAVLDGRVSSEFIEKVAPSYRNRAFDLCGFKSGPRSIDEEAEDDWGLAGTAADDDALNPIERAVELAFGN